MGNGMRLTRAGVAFIAIEGYDVDPVSIHGKSDSVLRLIVVTLRGARCALVKGVPAPRVDISGIELVDASHGVISA